MSGAWHSTGDLQEVSDRWAHASEAFEETLRYAIQSETHLWVIGVMHRATDQALDAFDGRADAPPILDADTLTGPPTAGCYICEQTYERRLRLRKCPGEPRRPR